MEQTQKMLSDVKPCLENGIPPRPGVPSRGVTLHANWRDGGGVPARLKKKTGTPLLSWRGGSPLWQVTGGPPIVVWVGGATVIPWVGVPLRVLWGDTLFPGRGVGALSATRV